jgi:N-acetylglucosamine kinase-like BadF-type ATPase
VSEPGFPRLVLAVDGGQTSSKAIIASFDGVILGWGTGSPCDHLDGPHGYQRNRDAIHSSARAALADAGATPDRIAAVGLGLTSAPRESDTKPIFSRIVRELCDPATIWVDADIVSNLAGASGGTPGVVVIAGGGSIGYGINDRGEEGVAGGLGYLLADEGSGWYIGLRAIQATVQAADLRGVDTALTPMILDHYGLEEIRHIRRLLYVADFSRDTVSTIAPKVVAIARDGDAVAREIVQTGARLLGDIAVATIRQIHVPDDIVPVFPTGGVFRAGEIVNEPFAATIAAGWPTATIAQPRFPPVIGAYLKALEAAGTPATPALLARLDAGIRARERQ